MKCDRVVVPERLDLLAPEDPRAIGSRRDLARINVIMFQARTMARVLGGMQINRILDIGAGDGQFMLTVARRIAPKHADATITLLDRNILPSQARDDGFEKLGWDCKAIKGDVFDYLDDSQGGDFDVIFANLFLHHFENDRLATLLELVSSRTRRFVACEPRRSGLALSGAKMLWAIGCNDVTLHDARVSVLAGFQGQEISALWPKATGWLLEEGPAPPFTHFFKAVRN